MGGKKEPAPYKLPEDNWLPKFASLNKTTSAPNKKERGAGRGESKPENGKSKNVIPFFSPKSDASNAPTNGSATNPTGKEHGMITGPFRPIPAPLPKRNSILKNLLTVRSAAKATRPFVQAELGLEGVRVVRNDLRDADVEVRRTALQTKNANETTRNPFAVETPKAETNWARITAQLLDANRPRA